MMPRGFSQVNETADRGHAVRGASARGSVFNVPNSEPFLRAVARAILDGNLPRIGGRPPEIDALPDYTILLPTRRAARALQEHFLELSGGRALLLPRIRAVAETNEELSIISSLAASGDVAGVDDTPPAVSELERYLVLTALVLRWSEAMRHAAAGEADAGSPMQLAIATGVETAAQAIGLARELASLMDMVETEDVSLEGLAKLVPEDFSEHWQLTLRFLEIALLAWPAHLEESGLVSPATRRNALIRAEAERLSRAPSAGPVIVAGVTGSIPASAALMRVVAGLDNGAIVLPGLDTHLDDESWQAIRPDTEGERGPPRTAAMEHPEHPQFGLKKLIEAIGVRREDVAELPGCRSDGPTSARLAFVSEALRPAATTEKWHHFLARASAADLRDGLASVSLIEAGTVGEEAEVVSLILRRAAETPGRTAALVTRDRLLARRVSVRLEAWGIRVDDSAGRPFAKTLPGTFLDLVIEAVLRRFAPVPLMALLKHPLTRLGLPAGDVRRAARALELAIFRSVYLGRGIDGVRRALAVVREGGEHHFGSRRVGDQQLELAADLVERLAAAMAPLEEVFADPSTVDLRRLVEAHARAAEALAAPPAPEGDTGGDAGGDAGSEDRNLPLWEGDGGEAAQAIVASLLDASLPSLSIRAQEYPDFYRSIAAREVVRSRVPVHPRLSIWGPFEARLQQPDVVVLGGLNEGSWPEAADPGPWLNRPMRQTLGLPQPEERIGYACHDFTALLGARQVYLTRALKVDGTPAVASRWLMRFKALAGGLGIADALKPDEPWLGWAANRSDSRDRRFIDPPRPCPPLSLRPRRLSVSDVERWVRNPYAVFASRILDLRPLPPLGAPPDAALRGSLVHAALSEFGIRFARALPEDPGTELIMVAREVLQRWTHDNRIAAFWVPRFERFAQWFAASEAARRRDTSSVLVEVDGQMKIDGPAGAFTLTARADRIDVAAGGIVITDYKTMSAGGLSQLARNAGAGWAPQLPLEAAIAQAGGFAGLGPVTVSGLRYISASGAEPPGAEADVAVPRVDALADAALQGLAALVARFDDPATAYAALRRPRFSYEYDDYALLARIGEWSAAGGSDGGEGE
jgi:ATP-dependent helicase/nuclease subunit B